MKRIPRIIGTLIVLYTVGLSLDACFNGRRPAWFVVINILVFLGVVYNLITLLFIPDLDNLTISDKAIQVNEKKNIKWDDVLKITYVKEDLNFENGPIQLYLKTENLNFFKKIINSKISIDTENYNLKMFEIIQIAESKNIEVERVV